MRVRIVFVAALVAAACGGAGGSAAPLKPTTTKKTGDGFTLSSAFSPTSVSLNVGDAVRFNIVVASNGEGHDVTFDAKAGAPANIPVTKTGTISRVFTTRGTFHYNCFVHPGMSGDVVVQ